MLFRSWTVWQNVPGVTANDIGIGPENTVWVVTEQATTGGFKLMVWDEQNGAGGSPVVAKWVEPRSQMGTSWISVGPTGRPWVVSNTGQIRRQTRD